MTMKIIMLNAKFNRYSKTIRTFLSRVTIQWIAYSDTTTLESRVVVIMNTAASRTQTASTTTINRVGRTERKKAKSLKGTRSWFSEQCRNSCRITTRKRKIAHIKSSPCLRSATGSNGEALLAGDEDDLHLKNRPYSLRGEGHPRLPTLASYSSYYSS